MPETSRTRLDQWLYANNYAPSRSRARDMIARGCVRMDGRPLKKAGQLIAPHANITIDDPAASYVSRAALKLIAGLDASGFNPSGHHALDLGASTGGFTQVLLERGAASVLALDVGHGQMAASIKAHHKVDCRENFNARHLTKADLNQPPSFIVSDLSFISLTLAAQPALLLAAPSALAILLVKPQFEVGKKGIGKGGLVNDQALVKQTLTQLTDWFNALEGWTMTKLIACPLTGGDGNLEYLMCGRRDGRN